MARKLTINERNILVDRAYNEIRTESISKLESEMQNNQKYQELMSVKDDIAKQEKDISNAKDKLEKMHKEFNDSLDNENFHFASRYPFHFDGDFRWEDKCGLRKKVETEIVLANLGDSVDFDKLIVSLKEKFGA
mgnify:CR=1 FL=1|tara:strand:- start:142 stop:543 length:402 start_codon:yes stop_codon:yes gene_type:complete